MQGHPHLPLLATSGIEDVVRIWAPSVGASNTRATPAEERLIRLVEGNQRRMWLSPQALGRASTLRRLLRANPHLLALLLSANGDEE